MSKTKHNRSFGKIVTVAMIFATAFTMVIGCNSSRRAERKVYNANRISRPATAGACLDLFPPKDSVRTITEYIQGETMVMSDTLYIWDTSTDVRTLYKTIYKTVTRVDTFRDSTYHKEQDTKEITLLKGELAKKDEIITSRDISLAKRTTQRNYWRIAAIAGWSLIVFWIVKKIWFK